MMLFQEKGCSEETYERETKKSNTARAVIPYGKEVLRGEVPTDTSTGYAK
jgi:hypothetical protein